MGANAVTTVPVYVAGEVLTAADLNITNSGIPVFATTVTRDASFGGSGEKTLAEGQFAYIEASDQTQYYSGSAWLPVGVTPGLIPIVPTSVAVGSGSSSISTNGMVTFTGASSVSLNGVFTSTYKNYQMILNVAAAGADRTITFRYRAAGSDNTVADYSYYNSQIQSDGTTSTLNGTDITSGVLANFFDELGCRAEIFAPQAALRTTLTVQSTAARSNLGITNWGGCAFTGATQFDGITLIQASNITGTVTIYGYNQ